MSSTRCISLSANFQQRALYLGSHCKIELFTIALLFRLSSAVAEDPTLASLQTRPLYRLFPIQTSSVNRHKLQDLAVLHSLCKGGCVLILQEVSVSWQSCTAPAPLMNFRPLTKPLPPLSNCKPAGNFTFTSSSRRQAGADSKQTSGRGLASHTACESASFKCMQ